MASSSSGNAGAGGPSGNPPLPLYYRGIPKDLGKKREPAPRYTPKLDKFGANLLQNINRKQREAKEKRLAQEKARARAQEEETKRKEEEIRLQNEQVARQIIAKSSGASRSRRPSLGSSRNSISRNGKPSTGIAKRRSSITSRGKRRKSKGGNSDSEDDAIIPMKGMEVVTRKKKPVAAPKIRNTSDYSDLFGADYLVGADVEATRELAKTSKAETERVRAAERERKAERERARKRGDEFDKIKQKMERSGELKTKAGREKFRRLRDEFQSEDYVSVSINNSTLGPKKAKTKKAQKEAEEVSLASRKAALKARLEAMVAKPDFEKFESKSSNRQPSSSRNQRPLKRSRVYSDDEYDSYEEERRRRPTKKPKKRPVYEDTDEDDVSDSDDGRGGKQFFTDFAELEEEEELSRKIGALEDKRELKAEAKRRREKAARRRAAGLDSDDD